MWMCDVRYRWMFFYLPKVKQKYACFLRVTFVASIICVLMYEVNNWETSGRLIKKPRDYVRARKVLIGGKTRAPGQMVTVLEERRQRLQKYCRWFDFKGPNHPYNIIVDLKRKLSYCPVPKIGSTFWKSVFAIVSGNVTNITSPVKLMAALSGDIHSINFLRFNKLSYLQRGVMKLDGKFILFVRDPYVRLHSAYMDKFVRLNKYYWREFGTLIVKYIRRKKSGHSRQCGHDVTFEEFLRFFVLSHTPNMLKLPDPHWSPIHQMCLPCNYPYTYIGKAESAFADTVAILKSANLSDVVDFQKDIQSSVNADIARRVDQFFEVLPDLQNCTDTDSVVLRIWKYLMAKGYMKSDTLPPRIHANSSVSALKESLVHTAVDSYRKQYFPGSVVKFRRDFVADEYGKIPRSVLNQVRDIVKPDCVLFDYDLEPPYIFKSSNSATNSTE